MPWILIFLALIVLPLPTEGQEKKPRNPHVADTPPLTPADQLKKFRLPPGFVIELVAAEPDVKKPINIAFDARGRLWVTGSEEYPFPAPKGRAPKDTVKILEDFGPDGRARKITTFADGLNIPIGVQPLPDCHSALVFSIPNIYLMRDTDGDGVADERKVLYSGYGFKDTHGMTGEFQYWIDGWIYCCHGFSNASNVKSKGETEISMQSGNTYRIKPDGSRIEQFTWGQVNPFGLAFDPRGFLYSADCHTRPVYQLLKGAYYPSFGKPHDGLGFGPEMVTHDHGSTAIAGVAYYTDDHFPPEYRDNLFLGNVVTNRINRDRVDFHGTSPQGIEQPDLVISDDPWFRPVDIKLGPDGALYVADFYNRIIGHYEVPLDHPGRDREKGRIWRIRYVGKDGSVSPRPVPDLTKMSVPELVQALSSPNGTTQMLSTQVLVSRDDVSVEKIAAFYDKSETDSGRVNRMWVLERRGKLSEEHLKNVHKTGGLARSHVLKLLGERPRLDEKGKKLLLEGLKDESPLVQRAAAEALSAHPSLKHVRPLLDFRHGVPPKDSHLLHVTRMALRNQLLEKKGPLGLDTTGWKEKDFRAIADVCLGVPTVESSEFLFHYLNDFPEGPAATLRFAHHIVRFGKEDAGRRILTLARSKYPENVPLLAQFLNTVKKARQERGALLAKEELAWGEDLAGKLLESSRASDVQIGIDLAGDFQLASLSKSLERLAGSPKVEEAHRTHAVAALVKIDPRAHLPLLTGILTTEGAPLTVRDQVANSLAATNQPEAHLALVKAMETVPARLQTTIAHALAGSPQGGEHLLKAVAAGKASPRLLTEPPIARRLEETKLPNLKDRLASLTKGFPAADKRLLDQQALRRAGFLTGRGEARLGKAVFVKHCAACHQVGSEGAKVGPQLDSIGIRGVDRLLEDILDPNRNIDQAFRASLITLKGGQVHNGLLLRKDGKVLVLADPLGKELRIPEDEIEEHRIVNLSPMPATYFDAIPERDFHDLVAYLLEQRLKDR